jgi:class 3 adenylate cyclase
LKHFLSHFIQENYRHGLLEGSLRACTMFVDLSGFTRMTEKLMQKGAAGAEEMSTVLNQIFQPTVTLVYEQGGFIPYFAGRQLYRHFFRRLLRPRKKAKGRNRRLAADGWRQYS